MAQEETVLAVDDLQVQFRSRDETVYAVNGVSFSVSRGEVLGVVGESGCGKSISMLSVIGLLPRPHGHVAGGTALFKGRNLFELPNADLTRIRGNEIAIVFQDPMVSFNPVYTIGNQLTETLMAHKKISRADAERSACEMLRLVGITNPDERLKAYPHQFSGGMRQRAMIAMALICNPDLLIADEPTTALDVTVQAQILDLMNGLKDEFGSSVMLITHSLGVVAETAQRVAVMYAAKVVEEAPVGPIFKTPLHPYTQGLLTSIPKMDETVERLPVIPGIVPSPLNFPDGCRFHNRCPECFEKCLAEAPPLFKVEESHTARCWLYEGRGEALDD